MSYSEDLKNGNWQRRRLEILQRDNFKCTICGKEGNLEIHHLDYLAGFKAWEYPNDMLTTLCPDHHKAEQIRNKIEKQLTDTLKMKGFMVGDLLAFNSLLQTKKQFTENLLKVLKDIQNG